MNWTVRRLTAGDAENARDARLEGLKLHPDAFSRDYEQDLKLTLDDWRERLAARAWFGGFVNGALAGIAAFSPGDLSKTAHTGSLGGMYVREQARGTGIAAGIIEAIIAHATGKVEQIELTVNADNARAIKLYERCGFRPVGRMPRALRVNGRYYDELSMVREVAIIPSPAERYLEVEMLPLSNKWAPILASQPESGMGYQIASVFLTDGRRFDHVTIVGGHITKIGGSTEISFKEAEIEKIVVNHGIK